MKIKILNLAFQSPFFTLITIFFLIIIPIFADESSRSTDSEAVITEIELIGLRRTKPHIARMPLERFIGMEAENFDLDEVFAVIQGMMILEPISAELISNGEAYTLRIVVEERWTIFPFPLITGGSGGLSFGLFIVDMNAFGMRDLIAVGGAYSSAGWTAIAMYNHNPRARNLPGWSTSFMYSRNEREDVDRNENLLRRYTSDRLRFSLGASYQFGETISTQLSISFTDISLNNNGNDHYPPDRGARHIGFNPGLSLRRSSWDGVFLSQNSLSLNYHYNHGIPGSAYLHTMQAAKASYHTIEVRGSYAHSFLPGFRMILRGGAVYNSSRDPLFEDGPNSAQVNILPSDYSARHYAGLSLGVEKSLITMSWGTLSLLASYQGAFSYSPLFDAEFNHGPVAGINFYLSRLAIPAIGTVVSYNVSSRLFQFGFSAGMSL